MSEQPKEYNVTLLLRLAAYSSEYTAVVSADSMAEAISKFIAEKIEHNCGEGEAVRVSARERKVRLGPKTGGDVSKQPETQEDRGRAMLVTCNEGRCLFCKIEGMDIVFVHHANEVMSDDPEGVCVQCLDDFQESRKQAQERMSYFPVLKTCQSIPVGRLTLNNNIYSEELIRKLIGEGGQVRVAIDNGLMLGYALHRDSHRDVCGLRDIRAISHKVLDVRLTPSTEGGADMLVDIGVLDTPAGHDLLAEFAKGDVMVFPAGHGVVHRDPAGLPDAPSIVDDDYQVDSFDVVLGDEHCVAETT